MATTAKRIKQESPVYPVCRSQDEVVSAIAAIGRHQRQRQKIEAAMNEHLATVRARYEKDAGPHSEAVDGLSKGVQVWCEANREQLTQNGKVKTASLATGKVGWRKKPAKVVLLEEVEKVVEALKLARLRRFLRITTEINKEAILANPKAAAKIPLIRIEQTENFVIVPNDTELA